MIELIQFGESCSADQHEVKTWDLDEDVKFIQCGQCGDTSDRRMWTVILMPCPDDMGCDHYVLKCPVCEWYHYEPHMWGSGVTGIKLVDNAARPAEKGKP